MRYYTTSSGGLTSLITGGDPLQGAVQGLVVYFANHLSHRTDPPEKSMGNSSETYQDSDGFFRSDGKGGWNNETNGTHIPASFYNLEKSYSDFGLFSSFEFGPFISIKCPSGYGATFNFASLRPFAGKLAGSNYSTITQEIGFNKGNYKIGIAQQFNLYNNMNIAGSSTYSIKTSSNYFSTKLTMHGFEMKVKYSWTLNLGFGGYGIKGFIKWEPNLNYKFEW